MHFTRSINGEITVGPTAIPCFGRENYYKFNGISSEAGAIIGNAMRLFLSNPSFRRVALTEPRKYIKRFLYEDASKLVRGLKYSDLQPSLKVGIWPQLLHWPTKKLVIDFLIKRTDNYLHILNAISPAFVCPMAIAKYVKNLSFQPTDEF